MTTKSRIEETIAHAEILSGQLRTCALDTEMESVRKMYEEMWQQVEELIPRLRGRLDHVQDEEPQFRP